MGERLSAGHLPPGELNVTVAAEPANLALIRNRLREWLAVVDVDPETAADALLAVGEATANAAEHAGSVSSRPVQMNLHAAVAGNRLHLVVSDNGRWKPVVATKDHRGHGLRLITALVDASTVTTTDDGTVVDMVKELRS